MAYKNGITTIKKTGSTTLTGDFTLTGGTNVTLTQTGNDILIAAAGGSAGTASHPLRRRSFPWNLDGCGIKGDT